MQLKKIVMRRAKTCVCISALVMQSSDVLVCLWNLTSRPLTLLNSRLSPSLELPFFSSPTRHVAPFWAPDRNAIAMRIAFTSNRSNKVNNILYLFAYLFINRAACFDFYHNVGPTIPKNSS